LEELLELFPPQATNPVAKAKIKIVFFIFLLFKIILIAIRL
jgi:hypothetical protein